LVEYTRCWKSDVQPEHLPGKHLRPNRFIDCSGMHACRCNRPDPKAARPTRSVSRSSAARRPVIITATDITVLIAVSLAAGRSPGPFNPSTVHTDCLFMCPV